MKRIFKQETEVKLRVEDAAEMRRRLRRLGGRVVRRVYECNTLFDTPKASLRRCGRLLRLREETPLLGRSREPRYLFTFKGPALQEDRKANALAPSTSLGTSEKRRYKSPRYKVREEVEFIITDPRAFLALAGQEGLRPSFRYEKYRTSYSVPGEGAHVEFDETPSGIFLEVEGSRGAIDRVARRLGYGPGEYITTSYAALHFEECRQRGVRAGDMMFESRNR